MTDTKTIRTALVSVFDKQNLAPIVEQLDKLSVKIISTGGTADYIRDLGVHVTTVENLTSYPSILGGRVKTLHPKIFGGILFRRDLEGDRRLVTPGVAHRGRDHRRLYFRRTRRLRAHPREHHRAETNGKKYVDGMIR